MEDRGSEMRNWRLLFLSFVASGVVALVGCGAARESSVVAGEGRDTSGAATLLAWRALQSEFPECHDYLVLDERTMERRLETHTVHLKPQQLSDAGIDVDTRWYYPVCRFAPADAGFVALLIEARGGAGGRDEEYIVLTRTRDGAPIAEAPIAWRRADCSLFDVGAARIALPAIQTTNTHMTLDCDADTLIATRVHATGSIAIASSGEIVQQVRTFE
jgi:hypothetical protein